MSELRAAILLSQPKLGFGTGLHWQHRSLCRSTIPPTALSCRGPSTPYLDFSYRLAVCRILLQWDELPAAQRDPGRERSCGADVLKDSRDTDKLIDWHVNILPKTTWMKPLKRNNRKKNAVLTCMGNGAFEDEGCDVVGRNMLHCLVKSEILSFRGLAVDRNFWGDDDCPKSTGILSL